MGLMLAELIYLAFDQLLAFHWLLLTCFANERNKWGERIKRNHCEGAVTIEKTIEKRLALILLMRSV